MQRVRGWSMTSAGHEALLDGARVLSEGEVFGGDGPRPRYAGTTMVTIELDRPELSVDLQADGAHRIGEAAARSLLLRLRLLRLARRELENRAAPFLPRGMDAEIEFHVEGHRLLVDINVESDLCELEGLGARDGEGNP